MKSKDEKIKEKVDSVISLFPKFLELVKGDFNTELVKFLNERDIEQLIYFQFKCKKKEGIVEPGRIISVLNNEINRRMYKQTRCLSTTAIIISIIAVVISIIK